MKNNIIGIVFKKELLDIFRDRKTLIMSILIPLILLPVMFGVIGNGMNKSTKDVQNNIKISIVDQGNSTISTFMKSQKNISVIKSTNIGQDVKDGKIMIAMEIPKNFDSVIGKEKPVDIKLTYDNASQQSNLAATMIESYIQTYSKGIVGERLKSKGINPESLNPINVNKVTLVKESESEGQFMLSLMLPLFLMIYSVTGPMAPATDLGAGEKERGTLEPLLTTKAGRLSLLWGKFLAITVMGCLTIIASIVGLLISMKQMQGMFGGAAGITISLTPKVIVLIGIMSILVTMAFGALELAISIYARSFKEAQTYLTPLTVIAFIPVYATYMLDGKNIDSYYFNIPLANVVCLMKEFLSSIFNIQHIIITFGWILVYIVASVLLARYMFSREEVVFRT